MIIECSFHGSLIAFRHNDINTLVTSISPEMVVDWHIVLIRKIVHLEVYNE